jgi:hypothetical protein
MSASVKRARPSHGRTLLRLLSLPLIISGLLFSAAMSTFLSGRSVQAERLDPATAEQVLVEGRVSADNALVRPPFVAYAREQRSAEGSYRLQENVTPALRVVLGDGVVQVAAGNYLIEGGVAIDEGPERYRGARVGDTVTVIGSVHETPNGRVVAADVLFVGTRDEYIAATRYNGPPLGWIGYLVAAVGVVLLVLSLRRVGR